VYVIDGDELEPRDVEIGLDNNSMIRIVSGLDAGEHVSLAPPMIEGAIEAAGYEEGLEIPEAPADTARPAQSDGFPDGGFPEGGQQGDSQQGDGFSGGGQQGGSQQGDGFSGGGQTRGNPMDMFDTDKDGKISKEEFPMPDRFSDIDKDGDGFITESEFSAGRSRGSGQRGERSSGSGQPRGNPMDMLDRDKDGKV
jgi:hypothetical protein